MTTFDADLVDRWFAYLLEPEPTSDRWLNPRAIERNVLTQGGAAIAAAVARCDLPTAPAIPADPAAAVLQTYLIGMATGIAGARQTMADSGDLGAVAVADRLGLVAGLIAAGAAVQVAPIAAADDSPFGRAPDPAALAIAAGNAAAELVVDGADLYSITSAAAATALATGPPDEANRETRYRARALIASVLVALQRSAAPAGAPVLPPSCGARPGVNSGTALLAEVTFTMFAPTELSDRLVATLDGLSDEVVVWSEGDRRYFHIHTMMAGEVIAEAYAIGTPFSLAISRLD